MNTELIHHFICTACKGWWSIASEEFMEPRVWFCPWCAHENDLRGVIIDYHTSSRKQNQDSM